MYPLLEPPRKDLQANGPPALPIPMEVEVRLDLRELRKIHQQDGSGVCPDKIAAKMASVAASADGNGRTEG